ncbi:uncharacterized protein LOC132295028 [Cornus florida]|uniref:uncharacterized protein LOC132295028 n=1 Tax=Cornus florida TaxID=4283 RepID=UPI00289F5D93|nr:uncharacterized protein LOC132295028 [Cornus florida]XP_059649081.1 uncharacterized protein LOC132295028 [Cornus florida]XP_059649082.1 uncharacterized protein LOC132295028 [Cornus florida]
MHAAILTMVLVMLFGKNCVIRGCHQVKLKERQSQEDEDSERDEDPAIRLYKDTHFKEQGGWAHEKAKRNFDAMKEKTAQNSQNSDGTSPTINDIEIVQNQLGIRNGYCRGFRHGFVAPKRQVPPHHVMRLLGKWPKLQNKEMYKWRKRWINLRRCLSSTNNSRHHGSSNISSRHYGSSNFNSNSSSHHHGSTNNSLHQIPNSSKPHQTGINSHRNLQQTLIFSSRHQQQGGTSKHHHNHQ